jgi:phosphoenolpyruvate synthase/pyruvate phosphate dikinase
MKYIRLLNEVSSKDITLAGGKAASLGELIQAGFPVPPGFVITTQAYNNRCNTLKKEVFEALDILATGRVAIRSSGVSEDSPHASWAGQLESYLNITRTNLQEAVENCWKSVHSERAVSYAKQHIRAKENLMVAVIVQKMVKSDMAGVMFTANPVTNNLSEMMIEAVNGLGEPLVQGAITPDNYLLDKKTLKLKSVVPVSQGKLIINPTQMQKLARLGLQIESHFGVPQDIEWAIEKGSIWIVQSRPITTL